MNIVQYAIAYSRRDVWIAVGREAVAVVDMHPHHLAAAVAALRRSADLQGVDDVEVRPDVDVWLSHAVPAFDAMLKRLSDPYVGQFVLEGPHRAYALRRVQKGRRRK